MSEIDYCDPFDLVKILTDKSMFSRTEWANVNWMIGWVNIQPAEYALCIFVCERIQMNDRRLALA